MRPRVRMTIVLESGETVLPALDGARPVEPVADREPLAALLLAAYQGTVDDDGETIGDALAEVDRLFVGEYGPLDAPASEVVERGGRLVAATLVTMWDGAPLIAFVFTDPACQRRGLARTGLIRAMRRLAARGEGRLNLVVTAANRPPLALYRSLGFVERG